MVANVGPESTLVREAELRFQTPALCPTGSDLGSFLNATGQPDPDFAADALSRMLLGAPLPPYLDPGNGDPEDSTLILVDRAAQLNRALQNPPAELICALAITAVSEDLSEEANRDALRSLLQHDRELAFVISTIGSFSPSDPLALDSLLTMRQVDAPAAEYRAACISAAPGERRTLRDIAYNLFLRSRGEHLVTEPGELLQNTSPAAVDSLLELHDIRPSSSNAAQAAALAVEIFAAKDAAQVQRLLSMLTERMPSAVDAVASLLLFQDQSPGAPVARKLLEARGNPIVRYVDEALAAKS